jgi:hypothetical protein
MSAFGWRVAATGLLVLALLPAPALAQVERAEPPPAGAATVRTAQTIGVAVLALRNAGPMPARLRLPASLRDQAGGTAVAVIWSRLQDGAVPQAALHLLPAGATATFEARADLPRPGSFAGAIEVLDDADAVIASFPLSLTRPVPMPAELLLATKPVRLTLESFYSGLSEPAPLQLIARNTTSSAVELGAVRVGRMAAFAGTEELSASISPPNARRDCPTMLEPQQDCVVSLVLPAGLGPGRYEFDVTMLGAGGGQSIRVQQVDIRRSLLWAWLAVAVGATLGAVVEAWRSSGRITVAARLAMAERRDRVEAVARAFRLPAAQAACRGLLQRLGALDARLREGATAADPTTFDDQVSLLEEAVQADAEAAALSPRARPLVAALHVALIKALEGFGRSGAAAQLGALTDTSTALRGGLATLNELVALSRDAAAALEAFTDTLREVGDGVQLRAAETGLITALEAAWAAPPAPAGDPDQIEGRRTALLVALQHLDTALQALPAHLNQLASGAAQAQQDAAELARVWSSLPRAAQLARAGVFTRQHHTVLLAQLPPVPPGAANTTTKTAPQRSQEVPDGVMQPQFTPLLRGPPRGATLDELAAYRTRLEVGTNVVVVAALGLVGVLVFWANSPSWGSATDLITALLAGIGTKLTLGTIARPNV